jgi:hypothetical protein
LRLRIVRLDPWLNLFPVHVDKFRRSNTDAYVLGGNAKNGYGYFVYANDNRFSTSSKNQYVLLLSLVGFSNASFARFLNCHLKPVL